MHNGFSRCPEDVWTQVSPKSAGLKLRKLDAEIRTVPSFRPAEKSGDTSMLSCAICCRLMELPGRVKQLKRSGRVEGQITRNCGGRKMVFWLDQATRQLGTSAFLRRGSGSASSDCELQVDRTGRPLPQSGARLQSVMSPAGNSSRVATLHSFGVRSARLPRSPAGSKSKRAFSRK